MIKRLLCYSYNKSQILYFKILYLDRKSTRLNSSHGYISYAVFCLKKKKEQPQSASAQTLTPSIGVDRACPRRAHPTDHTHSDLVARLQRATTLSLPNSYTVMRLDV